MSDPMTPDMHTAALQGLANNPIGQLYATAYQAGERAGAKTLGETTAVQAYGIGYQDGATLALIVRDLMDAAGYNYSPGRPLAEQAQECGQLIHDVRAMHDDLSTRFDTEREQHTAECQRYQDVIDELRKQLTSALKLAQRHGATVDWNYPELFMAGERGPDLGDDPDGDLEGADYPPFPTGQATP